MQHGTLALAETACELGDDEMNVNGVAESAAELFIEPAMVQAARSAVRETIRLITSDSGCIPKPAERISQRTFPGRTRLVDQAQ